MDHGQEQFEKGTAALEEYNYPSALTLLLPLAEVGNAEAQSLVGILYFESLYRFPKPEDEVGWNNLSKEELASWEAQDTPEAIKWLTKASEQGIGPASHNLAMLMWGLASTLSDPVGRTDAKNEARSLLKRAWEQGCAVAEFLSDDLKDDPSPEPSKHMVP